MLSKVSRALLTLLLIGILLSHPLNKLLNVLTRTITHPRHLVSYLIASPASDHEGGYPSQFDETDR